MPKTLIFAKEPKMKKLASWTILLIIAFALTACAKPVHMVNCPDCGAVFDAQQHAYSGEK